MKRLLLPLLWALPLLAEAQHPAAPPAAPTTVPVPQELAFAGLRLRFTPEGRAAVQQKVDALRRHPSSFQARVALADATFPLIERVFQEEGVPLDFRFLCLQESGLQGDAQSIHDAVGYWQFKREAAQDFALEVSDNVDERKHLVAATRAAAKYLLRSQRLYQNWLHTLLSYNLGYSGAKPYALPTDATATEMQITGKTHPYVLTFLAHKLAYEPAVGANPRPALLLREYPAMAGQSLATLARALQTNPVELHKHNRWLLASIVPTGKTYTALVPVTDSLQVLAMAVQQRQNAGQLVTAPETDATNAAFVGVNGLRAVVALPGESKEDLARRAGVKLRKFLQLNDLGAFDNVLAGQPYFVQKKRDKAAVEYHVAQAGESVEVVSQKYGIRARAIRGKNRMAANEALQTGRVLWLQHTRPREVAVEYVKDQNGTVAAALERPSGSAAPASSPVKPAPAPQVAANPAPVSSAPTPAPSHAAAGSAAQDSTASKEEIIEVAVEAPIDDSALSPPEPDKEIEAVLGGTASPSPAPAKKQLPASAPVADEPGEEPAPSKPAVTASAPVAKPTPAAPALPEPVATASASAAPARTSPSSKPAAPVRADRPAPAKPVASAVPVPTATASAPIAKPTPAAPVTPVPASGQHTVEKGENLYSVARRFSLRPADIIQWNNLPANPSLRIGQVLLVAPPTTPAPAATPKATAPAVEAAPTTGSGPAVAATTGPVKHTVAPGESMYAISRKYGVTIKDIMEWNGKPDFSVRPGEVLLIRPTK